MSKSKQSPKSSKPGKSKFAFEISLSVLNHLGRNLYRSFATVLGEAISNAWDADAKNVRITLDRENNSFTIIDDGIGMSATDFQKKFLSIGYSKRKEGWKSALKRPFIGRKGIGKLALLSCAERITVLSKVKGGTFIGGVIDNSGLDKAIKKNVEPQKYFLLRPAIDAFAPYFENQEQGTLIHFENIRQGVKHSLDFLKKIIALTFRFSLLDKSFKIFLEKEPVTFMALNELAQDTQFLWKINNVSDPYVEYLESIFTNENKKKQLHTSDKIKGFIASVKKPRNLNIMTTDERVGIDLFVNGRLRERDILKHIPTSRIVENYLYGQIHYDGLDEQKVDRFTSSREGIVADDPKYAAFLESFRDKIILPIVNQWDKWRVNLGNDGDEENPRLSPKDRKSRGLFNVVSKEFLLPAESANKKKVDGWVSALGNDAQYNFGSYAACFISENLVRKYIEDNKVTLSPEAVAKAKDWKDKEAINKNLGGLSMPIRRNESHLSYLDMDNLASLVDKKDEAGNTKDISRVATLLRDAKEYKPMRDALAHTALLTDEAKNRLTTVFSNIKYRVIALLDGK